MHVMLPGSFEKLAMREPLGEWENEEKNDCNHSDSIIFCCN